MHLCRASTSRYSKSHIFIVFHGIGSISKKERSEFEDRFWASIYISLLLLLLFPPPPLLLANAPPVISVRLINGPVLFQKKSLYIYSSSIFLDFMGNWPHLWEFFYDRVWPMARLNGLKILFFKRNLFFLD